MILTTKQIVEVLEMEKKATPEKWEFSRSVDGRRHSVFIENRALILSSDPYDDRPKEHLSNSEFITAFRNIARALMEEVLAGRELARFYGGTHEVKVSRPAYRHEPGNVGHDIRLDKNDDGGKMARAHLDRFVKEEK